MSDVVRCYSDLGDVSAATRGHLAKAYCTVFREAPWDEHWNTEAVLAKLRRELDGPGSFLAILEGDAATPVAGFCWGKVIPREAVVERVRAARGTASEADLQRFLDRVEDRVVFVDEIAKVPRYRSSGLVSVLRLVRPILDAIEREPAGVLCWSGPGSRIVPILTGYLDFDELGGTGDIHFYHLPAPRARQSVQRVYADFGALVRS